MPFTSKLPEWNAAGVEPPQTKKDAGWAAADKPPADWFNWFFNLVYLALQELQQHGYTQDEITQAIATAATTAQNNLTAHTSRTDNPHAVTKAQVGLGNADNTSDINKPVSTDQANADTAIYNNALNWVKSFGLGASSFLLANGYDLNTLTNTGFYRANASINCPPRVSGDNPSIWHYIINILHDSSWQSQIAIEYDTGTMFVRTKHDTGIWTSWKQVATTDGNIATASKLQTSRTISLTGDATGSIPFDGSANVSISIALTAASVLAKLLTVDGSGSSLDSDMVDGKHFSDIQADSQSKVDALKAITQNLKITADDGSFSVVFSGQNDSATLTTSIKSISKGFKTIHLIGSSVPENEIKGIINVEAVGTWAIVIGITNANNSYIMTLANGTLSSWNKINDSAADILSKLLGVDGSGSGLDGDTVDGKHFTDIQADTSAQISSLKSVTGLGQAANRLATSADLNTIKNNGWYDVQTPVNGPGADTWYKVLVVASGDINYITQLAFSMTNSANTMYMRQMTAGSWGSWKTLSTIDGNVASATKLQTARTLALGGDASGSVAFDGSSNQTITVVLANTGVAVGTYTKLTIDSKGRVTSATTLSAADIPNLDWSKITSGKPTTLSGYGITDALPSSSYTAADVLSKLLGVDGSGSGLDADKLDGLDSTAFAPSGFGLGTAAQLLAVGTDLNTLKTTGFYRVNAGANVPPRVSGDNPGIYHYVMVVDHDSTWTVQTAWEYNTGTMFTRTLNNGTWTSWAKAWTDSNDGSGSGLDADLVRGIDVINQLSTKANVADFGFSNADNSHIMFPGPGSFRFIIQWGVTSYNGGDQVVTYPFTFPNKVFSVQLTSPNVTGSYFVSLRQYVGTNSFTMTGNNSPVGVLWVAFGY